jgi:uncharacterized RDD family membrane protein YckC
VLALAADSCFPIAVATPSRRHGNGVVAAASRGTARLVLYPVRAGLRSGVGVSARRELEDVAVEALAGRELEELVDRLLAGPLPETVARSLVENRVLERVTQETLRRSDLEAVISSALASEEADRVVARAVQSPAFKRALEEALASPAVRTALTRQTQSAAHEALDKLRTSLEGVDDSVERPPRRWFRRAQRIAPPPEAGFATRGVALALDAVLVNLLFLAGAGLVALIASLAGGLPTWVEAVLSGVGFTATAAAYFVFFWSIVGSTPAMLLLRLRVVTSDGRPLGLGRAIVRLVGLLLSIAILFLGFVPALVSDRRRALQDYLAGTVMLREPRG